MTPGPSGVYAGKSGLPPGTPLFAGKRRSHQTEIRRIDFDRESILVTQIDSDQSEAEVILPKPDLDGVRWIHFQGVHDGELISRVGGRFGIHPLVIEDILHTGQRPKAEDYGDFLYVVARSFRRLDRSHEIEDDQISFILTGNVLLTFSEREDQVFEIALARLKSGSGKVRESGADYLLYSLLDITVDGYFLVLEEIGEELDRIDDKMSIRPQTPLLNRSGLLGKQITKIRRAILPLREAVHAAEGAGFAHFGAEMRNWLRDLSDHLSRLTEMSDALKDANRGIRDLYMAGMSLKLNNAIRVLTVISTIFIPLTFLTGIYGMNFDHMPELRWRYGYAAMWAVSIVISAVLLLYYKRKKWL